MQVALISYTANHELTIAATRVSYSSGPAIEFLSKLISQQVSSFLGRLILVGHFSLSELINQEVGRVAPFIETKLKSKCYRLGYFDEAESCRLFPLKQVEKKVTAK